MANMLLSLLPVLIPSALARMITVKNSCSSTIWPGMNTGGTGGDVPSQPTGWQMTAGQTSSFTVSDNWTAGRIWARTGCAVQNGNFQCLTGGCGPGTNGDMTWYVPLPTVFRDMHAHFSVVSPGGGQPPATLGKIEDRLNG